MHPTLRGSVGSSMACRSRSSSPPPKSRYCRYLKSASGFDDQISLLDGHNRATRHQTLQAVVDWSYQLLTESERALMRRVSVFAGGWTLEAAETIGPGATIDRPAVFGRYGAVGRQIAVIAETQGSEARTACWRLYDTTRRENWRRRKSSTQRRMPISNISWCSPRKPKCYFGARAWLNGAERIAIENDNMRAALRWSLGGGDVGAGLRLAERWHFSGACGATFNEGSDGSRICCRRHPRASIFARAKAYSGLVCWHGGKAPPARRPS